MGSQDIRTLLGGRHKDDRGLYVSSGGFSKEARSRPSGGAFRWRWWTSTTSCRLCWITMSEWMGIANNWSRCERCTGRD